MRRGLQCIVRKVAPAGGAEDQDEERRQEQLEGTPALLDAGNVRDDGDEGGAKDGCDCGQQGYQGSASDGKVLRHVGVGEGVVEVREASVWDEEKDILSLEMRKQLLILHLVARLLVALVLVHQRRAITVMHISCRRNEQRDGKAEAHDGNGDIVHVIPDVSRLVVPGAQAEVDGRRDDAAELLEGDPGGDAAAAPALARVADDDEALDGPEDAAGRAAEHGREDEEPLRPVPRVLVQRRREDGVADRADGQAPLGADLVDQRAAEQADDAHERKVDGRGRVGHVRLLLAGAAQALERVEGADGA